MTKPDQPADPDTGPDADTATPPVSVDARTAATLHLNRAAMIMDAIASAADNNDGYLDLPRAEGMFRQAEIHALIGGGYASLARDDRRLDTGLPTNPPVTYPNG